MASQCPLPTLAMPRAGILTEGMGPRQRAEKKSMCESPWWRGIPARKTEWPFQKHQGHRGPGVTRVAHAGMPPSKPQALGLRLEDWIPKHELQLNYDSAQASALASRNSSRIIHGETRHTFILLKLVSPAWG